MGSALQQLRKDSPEDFESLKNMVNQWPFLKYRLIQIETNLLNADPKVMKEFAQLVPDASIRSELMELIEEDYEQGLQQIEQLMNRPTTERRLTRVENIRVRGRALALLHEIQIKSIKEWRSLKESDPKAADQLLLKLLLLVNALSGGLKGTG